MSPPPRLRRGAPEHSARATAAAGLTGILSAVAPKLYRAAEVCEATGLQPYILRSWEKEFPGIGVQKSADSPRLYRQSDVEQVLRIKHLVFVEGLTLAGARRRLDDELPKQPGKAEAEVLDMLGADARSRIDRVRSGLRSILEVLSKRAGAASIKEVPRNGGASAKRKPVAAGRKAANGRVVAKRSVATRRAAASSRAKVTKRVAPKPRPATQKGASAKRKRA